MGSVTQFVRGMDWWGLLTLLISAAAALLCITLHELSHGFVAWRLGDPTAKRMHRLSFNPLHHIDWLGLLAMLVCGFGWAKPVPVDMRYFKNPKAGMALTALAGPVSNFLLALLSMLAASLMVRLAPVTGFTMWVLYFLIDLAILSIGLGLFNLMPVLPLDGGRALWCVLSALFGAQTGERAADGAAGVLVGLLAGIGAAAAVSYANFTLLLAAVWLFGLTLLRKREKI